MALAPDPFDEDVERLLADPAFRAELEKRRARRECGEEVVVEDAGVRRRMRDRGVPLSDPEPSE